MNEAGDVPARPRALRELTALEARVLGVLVEKERTVPDTYPLTLNALVAGCGQKSNRNPVIDAREADVLAAVEALKALSLVIESSGGRVMRYAQNFKRVVQVPTESVALLATLMLRGPQTAAELRAGSERLCRISDVSAAEAFLHELATRTAGALAVELPRQPGSRENRWMHRLCGDAGLQVAAAGGAAGRASAGMVPAADTGLQVDLPDVRAEVEALFARYQQAFVGNDAEAMTGLLWQSPQAMHHGAGRDVDGTRAILRTRLTCFGRDYATSLIEFSRQGVQGVGREGHAWARLPQGWRIVAANAGGPSDAPRDATQG